MDYRNECVQMMLGACKGWLVYAVCWVFQ
jgi:hypothetical protein